MPNVQFSATDEYWWKHKNLPPKTKKEINDALRTKLYEELDKTENPPQKKRSKR
jgi:hypothetical protein